MSHLGPLGSIRMNDLGGHIAEARARITELEAALKKPCLPARRRRLERELKQAVKHFEALDDLRTRPMPGQRSLFA